jgi:polysaccharide export outer membrane protein
MRRILNGKDPDPVLQAQDIVFYPSVGWKAAIKSGGISTVLGIAQILIYSAING